MGWLYWIIPPLIGALIGWFTNYLAVKMLFRPLQPVRIPLLNYVLQGVIPKRHQELAKTIGRVVEEELVCLEDLLGEVKNLNLKKELKNSLAMIIEKRVKEKFPHFLPTSLKFVLIDFLREAIFREVDKFFDHLMDNLINNSKEKISIGKMVEEKVANFELSQLEKIILDVARNELKHIEILGGVLGFLIGIIQVLFIYLLNSS